MGLFIDVEIRFNLTKTVSIRAGYGRKQVVTMDLSTSAAAEACGDTSITVSKNYLRQRNIPHVNTMWAHFSSFIMPITAE